MSSDQLKSARKRIASLEESLQELLNAATSIGATDSRVPITWSGSAFQNRAMYVAIDNARTTLRTKIKPYGNHN